MCNMNERNLLGCAYAGSAYLNDSEARQVGGEDLAEALLQPVQTKLQDCSSNC